MKTVELHDSIARPIFKPILSMIVILLLVIAAKGQQSATDSATPAGIAPGAPAGAFSVSGMDTVNLFSGNLNFNLPLLNIGGRGAQTAVMLSLNSVHWRAVKDNFDGSSIYYAEPNEWDGIRPGYGPGVVQGRRSGTGGTQTSLVYGVTLTRLTFTAPDGTEYELRDQLLGGQPLSRAGQPDTISRGRVFISADGSSMTFISDTTIQESRFRAQQTGVFFPYGLLLMADGTRYRIDNGLVTWICDRNGNKIDFEYEIDSGGFPTFRVKKIIDSLNRQVSITYANMTTVLHDQINFTGFGGVQRSIKVKYSLLRHALRSDFPMVLSHRDLFQELGASSTSPYDPFVVSEVEMPDSRDYVLKYNVYGELARIVLPTGAAINYDYTPGNGVFQHGGDYQIYRRVIEREVYVDGSTLEGKTVYTATHSLPADPTPHLTTVDVEQRDGPTNALLAKARHKFHGSPVASLFEWPVRFYPAWKQGREYETEAIDKNGTSVLKREAITWQQGAAVGWWTGTAEESPAYNVRIAERVSTWVGTSQVTRQRYTYDQFNNRTSVEEFDYGIGSAPTIARRRTEIDYVTTSEVNGLDYTGISLSLPNSSIHMRRLPKEQRIYAVDLSTGLKIEPAASISHFYYDQTPVANLSGLTGYLAPASAARGNLTTSSRWLNTINNWVSVTQKYDVAGHVIENTDALGKTSLVEFANSLNTYAYPSAIKTVVPDPTGQRGSASRLQSTFDYDFSSGLMKSATDANGHTTSYFYNDILDRLTTVLRPAGGGQTNYLYGDSPGNLYITTQSQQSANQTLEATQFFDGLGRSTRSSISEGATQILADIEYDSMNRVSRSSNPYRAGDTLRWTTRGYDALGRVLTVTKPDGAQYVNSFSGNTVTVSDPASKSTKTTSDALGRITQVIEDPGTAPHLNLVTTYTQDALGLVRKVNQGSQTRFYMYDSLSRLIRVRPPEHEVNTNLSITDPVTGNSQWSMSYTYDNNGNKLAETDARNITTNYTYDAMNRLLNRSYSNDPTQTPAVSYKYDGVGTSAQNALGQLTQVSSAISTCRYDNFDAMGRVLGSTQITDGQTYSMSYGYNFVGSLTSETYPSGRVVTTEYDAAGRISRAASEGTVYVDSISYGAHGGVEDLRLGNGLWEHVNYDPNRLQITQIGLGTSRDATDKLKLNYGYGTTTNNGSLLTHTITIPGGPALTQTYMYDELNRLKVAQETGGASWKQTFTYDAFGNRSVDVANTTAGMVGDNPLINAATNRIQPRSGELYLYDKAGNLTRDAVGNLFTYDAESMQISSTVAGGTSNYSYDGNGQRVKKVDSNGTTVFVYDAGGKLVAEYTSAAPAGGGASYVTVDVTGTPRVITDSNKGVKARHDYLPYGEEISAGVGGRTAAQRYVADTLRQKFTGKERDGETRLDYFGARYYSSSQGRFMSADSLAGSGNDPQTLNLYAYVMGNPLNYTDPTGNSAKSNEEFLGDFGETGSEEAEGEHKEALQNYSDNASLINHYAALIDEAAKNGQELVFFQAGISNDGFSDKTINKIAESEEVSSKQVIAVPNSHGKIGGGSQTPNPRSVYLMSRLLNYAINTRRIHPGKITLIAHSNGVPTLRSALEQAGIKGRGKFKDIQLYAPATDDARVIKDIAKKGRNTRVILSDADNAMIIFLNVDAWTNLLAGKNKIEVIQTYKNSHALLDYLQSMKDRDYKYRKRIGQ